MPMPRVWLLATALFVAICVAGTASAQPFPDVFVTKTGPDTAAPGDDITYAITIGNVGDDSGQVTLDDPIPPGMTFVSFVQNSGPAFSCAAPPPVSCTVATLLNGQTATFTLVLNIPVGTAPGTSFTNQATGSTAGDVNSENDTGVAVTTVPTPSADVSVTKTGPAHAGANTDITYDITVTNNGPDPADSVTLGDTLPGTTTFVSFSQNSGPPFICTTPGAGSGGTVNCSIATLVANAPATFQLTVHIPAGTNGTFLNNQATVGTTTEDPAPENNNATWGIAINDTDLSIAKSNSGTANAGGSVAYTITIANGGPDAALSASWTDTLPTGTTFSSLVQNTGPASNCSTPLPGTTGSVSCTFALPLASGNGAQYTLTVNVDTAATNGTIISNTATASSDSFDPDPSNNSATSNTTVIAQAEISVNKSAPANTVAGGPVTFTVNVTNGGPTPATSVSLTDATPAGTTFVSNNQTAGPTFNCTNPAVGGTGTITCSIASLPNGGSATFDLTFLTSASAAPGTIISNTANVSSTTPEQNSADDSSTATTTITTSADVAVVKTAPAGATAGTNISYTITVTNNGPSDASTVSMTDTTPPGTTFVSEAQTTGPTFNCTTPAPGGTGTITCNIATLAASANATFNIVVQTPPSTPAGTNVSNTANVSSTTSDPNPGNNSSTGITAITAGPADLSITKTSATTSAIPGAQITYNITVSNAGPASALNVNVTDVLPAGAGFVSANPSQGSCSGTTTVTCSLGAILANANATIALTITAPPSGPVSNTATVTAANTDPNPANNSATAAAIAIGTTNVPALDGRGLLLLAAALAAVATMMMRR